MYNDIVNELKRGEKKIHWIWFIFSQIKGLGFSSTTQFFSIESIAEAISCIAHSVLGLRLIESCEILMKVEVREISQILSPPDDKKL